MSLVAWFRAQCRARRGRKACYGADSERVLRGRLGRVAHGRAVAWSYTMLTLADRIANRKERAAAGGPAAA